MIRDAVASLDMTTIAEVALVLFVVAFLLIVFLAKTTDGETMKQYASIPLNDGQED